MGVAIQFFESFVPYPDPVRTRVLGRFTTVDFIEETTFNIFERFTLETTLFGPIPFYPFYSYYIICKPLVVSEILDYNPRYKYGGVSGKYNIGEIAYISDGCVLHNQFINFEKQVFQPFSLYAPNVSQISYPIDDPIIQITASRFTINEGGFNFRGNYLNVGTAGVNEVKVRPTAGIKSKLVFYYIAFLTGNFPGPDPDPLNFYVFYPT